MKAGILIGHLKLDNNEGAIIRTAEAFGINNVFVIGEKKFSYPASEGADRHMNFFEFKTIDDFIGYAYKNNFHLVSLENVNESKEIEKVRKYPCNPIFITGNEKTGVPAEILKMAHLKVKIEQTNSYVNCLNTSTACGIVIHDFFKKMKSKRTKLWSVTNRSEDDG